MQLFSSLTNADGMAPRRVVQTLAVVVFALAVMMLMATVVSAGTHKSAARVTVKVDGQSWEWVSTQATVGSALKEAGVVLGAKDYVQPGPNEKISSGMHIKISRITENVTYKKEPVAFRTVVKFDPRISTRRVIREGQQGEKEVQCLHRYKDGVRVAEKIIGSTVTKKPVDRIVSLAHPTMLASRDSSYVRRLRMHASAYTPFHCGGSASGNCAMGFRAGKGVVAVDPRIIPLGTKLYIEGYGMAMAADTGGAIKGSRIDLCFDTYSEAIRYGRKTVTVWVLDSN